MIDGIPRFVPAENYAGSFGHKSLLSLLQWKYVLRPITKRMENEKLDSIIQKLVSVLLPLAITLKKIIGRFGARLLPIVEYSNLGLPYEVNLQWSLLDTFDIYSPAHDHPQSLSTVRRWFTEARFFEINVRRGPNGVVGIGRKPLSFSKGN